MGILSSLGLTAKTNQAHAEVSPTPRAVASRIKTILGIRQLEPMPSQAARAFQLASDPRATAADFVSVVESDEVISSRIIRIANSVYFFRGTAAVDIEKAVANIGLNELRCLLSATLLKSLLKGRQAEREQIWANAVATGICARQLSRYTNGIGDGEAFLCGLVHDLGKLIMLQRAPDLYRKVQQKLCSGEIDSIDAEEEVFEINHIEVGKWVAESWNFPKSAIMAISLHHEPWPKDITGKVTSTALLVKIADTIAHSQGIGHPPEQRKFQTRAENQLPNAVKLLGISTGDTGNLIQSFRAAFDKEYSLYQSETGS